QISRCFRNFRCDSLDDRTGNFWEENRETIFNNREFPSTHAKNYSAETRGNNICSVVGAAPQSKTPKGLFALRRGSRRVSCLFAPLGEGGAGPRGARCRAWQIPRGSS